MAGHEAQRAKQGQGESITGTPIASVASNQAFVSGALQSSESVRSSHGRSNGVSSQRDSLDAVAGASVLETHFPSQPDAQALLTPLPGSPDDGSVAENHLPEGASSANNEDTWISYRSTIRSLSEFMPHLRNVQKRATVHQHARVRLFDCISDTIRSVGLHTFEDYEFCDLRDMEDSFKQRVTESIPAQVRVRFVLVEDLSHDLMSLLGNTFQLNPEFFEEHLINSGWSDGSSGDPEATTWNTRFTTKNYVSIRWYRPIRRLDASLDTALALSQRGQLMSRAGLKSDWPLERGTIKRLPMRWNSLVNIMRRKWDLSPNESTEKFLGRSLAWEERATLCITQIQGCSFVVMLLDPLPVIKETTTRVTVEVPKKYPSGRPKEIHEPSQDSQVNSREDESQPGSSSASMHVAPANRASQNESSSPDAGTTNTDPEKAVGGPPQIAKQSQGIASKAASLGNLLTKAPWLTADTSTKPQSHDEPSKPASEAPETYKTVGKNINYRVAFQGLAPRLPCIDPTLITRPEYRAQLLQEMHLTTSTAHVLTEALETQTGWGLRQRESPVVTLFMIVQRDTIHLLDLMDMALTEISNSILDDSMIQRQVDHWRALLNRYDTELRHMESSLREFSIFVKFITRNHLVDAATGAKLIDSLLTATEQRITSVKQRTKSSDTSLLTTMSLVESKRGIAEAESVTKLTELAFFFIPLTFSASVFSMQIKELKASDTSVSAFITVALLITLGSYAIRLFVRSTWLAKSVRRSKSKIRADAKLPSNAGIPTTSLLLWLYHRTYEYIKHGVGWPASIFAMTTILTAGILAGLWSKPLEVSIKVAITITLVFLYIICLIIVWHLSSLEFRLGVARALVTAKARSRK